MPPMEHGKCYLASDCLTIWDVLARWRHISYYELERLINEEGGRPPRLQPYEVEYPATGGKPDAETMYLHPMRRGALRIVHVHEFHDEVRDARNRLVAADADEVLLGEDGDPLLEDRLYFLLGDVLRLERKNPDYLAEIPPQGKGAPAETPPMPAEAPAPPRPAGRMLHAKDAAALLGCSRSHFWALVKRGEIVPGIRRSAKDTVWHEEDVWAYMRACEKESGRP